VVSRPTIKFGTVNGDTIHLSLSDGSPPGIDAWTLTLTTAHALGHKTDVITSAVLNAGDFQNVYDCLKKCGKLTDPPKVTAHAAPELDASTLAAALTLLAGGLLVLKTQRRTA
jgi:hypothetical protein